MTPILVTGGAGYIGSHTCKALLKAGFLPIVFDNFSTGHPYAVKWGPLIHNDLSSRKALDEAFLTFKPKAVLHFAADSTLFESIQNPGKYYRNNVANTLNLLEAMRDHDVRHIVFSSTCATYGMPESFPITEEHPQKPISPYGKSKKMVEEILADFTKAHNFSSLCLRYFNAAGADLDTEIGENHTPETHLIPLVILTALAQRPEITIYGTDFPTRDGSAIRDYIHVNDLARGHVLALQWLLETGKSSAINLGTGTGYSVFEIIEAVQAHAGKTVPVKIESRRDGEPHALTAGNAKAKEILGWEPEYSDIKTVIGSAWKWHELLIETRALLMQGESFVKN